MSECLSCSAIIVDDHPLARMAIRSVLEKQRITIINEYEDGAAALKALAKTVVDIVVVDVEIPVLMALSWWKNSEHRVLPGY